MGLVGFLLGEKIENENKTKPFHANQNTVERKDWFLRTRPWHRVDPKITSALIEKFGDNPMFEAFVLLSMKQKLIDHYAALAKNEAIQGTELICSQIAAIVCMLGNSSLKAMGELMQASHFNEAKLSRHYGIVRDAFETTIILDNNFQHISVSLQHLHFWAKKKKA